VSRLAASFLRLARDDLAAARRLLPDMPRVASFLLQQAAEKLVKAALVEAGTAEPPRWHDIGRLVGLLPLDHPRLGELAALADLSAYAVTARYPLGDEVAPEPDPEQLLERADRIVALLGEWGDNAPDPGHTHSGRA